MAPPMMSIPNVFLANKSILAAVVPNYDIVLRISKKLCNSKDDERCLREHYLPPWPPNLEDYSSERSPQCLHQIR